MEMLKPMLLWIPVILLTVGIWWATKHRKTLGRLKREREPARDDDGHHEPAPVQDPHHPPKGDGGQNHKGSHHDNHSHHGASPWPWVGLLVTVVIVMLLWTPVIVPFGRSLGIGAIPGAPREVRREIATRHLPAASLNAGCPVGVDYEWQPIAAPPASGARSRSLAVPKCHHIRFCDRERDPECAAATFEGSRFNLKCDGSETAIIDGKDSDAQACNVQSNDEMPVALEWRFEFDNSQ